MSVCKSLQIVTEAIKDALDIYRMVDIGLVSSERMGVSPTLRYSAAASLFEAGYSSYTFTAPVLDGTLRYKLYRILASPDISKDYARTHSNEIHQMGRIQLSRLM